MMKKIDQAMFNTYAKMLSAKAVKEERGDTNFISIIIILGVVIALLAVFTKMQEQIVGKIQEMVNNFSINIK